MRGWASIMVMYYHIVITGIPFILPIAFLYSGYSGVYFFFLISGYILMRKLDSGDYNVKGKLNIMKYYLRRIFRIWPLYFISIPLFVGTNIPWQYFFFLQNYFPSTFSIAPIWTLVIEELFYLILPLWAIAFHRRWKTALLSMAGLTILYMALATLYAPQHLTVYAYAQFPTFALTYALGTLIARGKTVKMGWPIIAIAWLAVSSTFTSHYAQYEYLPVILFSIVYYLVLSNMENSWFFTNRLSQFLGSLTYPIYLAGLPIQVVLIKTFGPLNLFWVPLVPILTIATAYVLHHSFERPLIGIGRVIETLIWKKRTKAAG